jgi:7-carboxy-7-deazaguanine synthase
MYRIKEVFKSIQGEGSMAGTAMIFVRFAGCPVGCAFCDTDYVGTDGSHGFEGSATDLLDRVGLFTVDCRYQKEWVLLTGGEPAVQVDDALIKSLHDAGLQVAIETSGMFPIPADIDHVCVSPKAEKICVTSGDDLKVLVPDFNPMGYDASGFRHKFVQPVWGDGVTDRNTEYAVDFVETHTEWRLSVQTHKFIGVQ